MALHTPKQLLIDQLRDLLSCAEQLRDAWPKLIELSTHNGLRSLLLRHEQHTRSHEDKLRALLRSLGSASNDDCCKAMKGLLEGGEEHLLMVPDPPLRDILIIAHCLRVEAYEVVAHEVTSHLAGECGQMTVATEVCEMLDSHATTKRELESLRGALFQAANQPVA